MSEPQSKNDPPEESLGERRAKRAGRAGHYPIVLVGEGRRALVVGGGAVAERKVRALIDGGITTTVVSPHLTPALQQLWTRRKITHVNGRFPDDAPDLRVFSLIIAATDDRETNRLAGEQARAAGILVNIADDPENSDFHTPAVAKDDRLGVMIAVSTSGTNPRLARAWRGHIAEYLCSLTNEEVQTHFDKASSKDSSG